MSSPPPPRVGGKRPEVEGSRLELALEAELEPKTVSELELKPEAELELGPVSEDLQASPEYKSRAEPEWLQF